MNKSIPLEDPRDKGLLIFVAWLSILLVSDLPDIMCSMIFGEVSVWIFWGKVGFLGFFFGLCHFWQSIRSLQPYALIMLVLYVTLAASDRLSASVWWQGLINNTEPSFALYYLRPYIRDTGVALAVISALWIVKRRRSEFFLVRGQLNAAIGPVRWLGIRQGESWRRFGWIFAVVAALVVAVPSLLPVHVSSNLLARVVPLFPAVLLFAAINAFNEEIYYRTTLFSTLPQVIGRNHALLINVVFFGLAHYLYGSPPGMVGALMTGFLAWLLGKSMLETKGLFWPWFMHFLPDVVIFFSYAIIWATEKP